MIHHLTPEGYFDEPGLLDTEDPVKIVGFDYWQTLSAHPKQLGYLIDTLILGGYEVHVITAVGSSRVWTVKNDFSLLKIAHTAFHVVEFKHPSEAPALKLAKCQELNVQMFFDDRRDICDLLNRNGIIAFNIMRKDNKTYDFTKYPKKGIDK